MPTVSHRGAGLSDCVPYLQTLTMVETEGSENSSLCQSLVVRDQELCESRGGRPGLPSHNKPAVSVDVTQDFNQLLVLGGRG